MANYTAADVKRLRELTGAGMLACKNALAEADGDFDKAVEELRIKGAKDVGKRAERATAEGLVAAKDGALIELNSETDFVAKNAEFQKLADEVVAAAVAAKATDVDALKAAKAGDSTVEQAIAEMSAKLGEKLELRRSVYFDGNVETYLHKRSADLPPAVGVLVEYESGTDVDGTDAAHAVALQIAALKAKYLTRDDVPADIVANERHIAEETAKAEGKPEAALPKIIEGRVTGFYKDVVLLDQPSVSDNKKTVKALLDEAGVTVTRFVRFEVGQA
ncbi:translation elongation factor Ts [soil metagenome]